MAPVLLDAASETALAWPLVLVAVAASLSLALLVVLCASCHRAKECEGNSANVILTNAVQKQQSQEDLLLKREEEEEANGEVTNGTGAAQDRDAGPSSTTGQQDESSDLAAGDEHPVEAAGNPPSPTVGSCCARQQRRGAQKQKGKNVASLARRDSDDNAYENMEDAIHGMVRPEAARPTPALPKARDPAAPQPEPYYAEVRKKPKDSCAKPTPRESKKTVVFKDGDGERDGESEEVAPPPPEKTWVREEKRMSQDASASGADPSPNGSSGQASPRETEVLYATVEVGGGGEMTVTHRGNQIPAQRPPSTQRAVSLPRSEEKKHVTYAEMRLQQTKSEKPRNSSAETHYATIISTVGSGTTIVRSECLYATVQPATPASQ